MEISQRKAKSINEPSIPAKKRENAEREREITL
jgi:hypothetical protein